MFFDAVLPAIHRYAASTRRIQCAIGWVAALVLLLAFAGPAAAQVSAKARATPAATRTVLVMGDSLSAAHGLAEAQGWVALTGRCLASSHPDWKVVNASISGETTAGGAARIAGELARHRPSVVVIELGANDGLRGLPLGQSRAHLERMIRASRDAGARVLLIGMRMPPNFGRAYTDGFAHNYAALAKQYELAFVPFLLEPIALDRSAFQDDNLHPVAAAQPMLRDHVWPTLESLLD